MESLFDIINVVLSVFLIIGLGYLLGITKFISKEGIDNIRKLTFYVSLPVLLFRSASLSTLSEAVNIKSLGAIFLTVFVVVVIAYLAAWKSEASRRGVLVQGMFRTNMVFIGLPVITYAYGDAGLSAVVVLVAFIIPVMTLMAVIILSLPHQAELRGAILARRMMKEVACNPLAIGCVIGLMFSGLHLSVPEGIGRSMDLVGRIALPLALLMVGSSLDFGRLRGEIVPSLMTSSIKLVLFPGLICLLLILWGESGIALKATVIMMAAPSAPVGYIMAVEMKGDEYLASSLLVSSTVLFMFTSVAWLYLLTFMD